MQNKIFTVIGTTLIASLLAAPVQANKRNSIHDYARVTHVEPKYHYVTVRKPQEHCHYVTPSRGHYRNHQHNNRNRNRHQQREPRHFIRGEIFLNNRSGNASSNTRRIRNNDRNHDQTNRRRHVNNNQHYGHNDNRRHNRNGNKHRNGRIQRCVTTTVSHRERRLNGYNVTYVYRGNTFYTITDQHPGNRIRISVQVRPH